MTDSVPVEILGRRRTDAEKVDVYTRWTLYTLFFLFPFMGFTLAEATVLGVPDLSGAPTVTVARLLVAGLLLQAALGVPVAARRVSEQVAGEGNRRRTALDRWLEGLFGPLTVLLALLAVLMPGGEGVAGRAGAVALPLTAGLMAAAPGLSWRAIAVGVAGTAVLAELSIHLEIPALGMTAGQGPAFVIAVALALAVGAMASSSRLSVWVLQVVWELERTRAVHARLAVAEERLRFSRDLHDVVGRALSAVAVKSELGAEMARRGRPEAVAQMGEVRDLAQETLKEMRAVVAGYRATDLGAELEGARSVLRSAGVEVEARVEEGLDLPAPVQEALAWAVREGVTNVVRHAAAAACRIELTADADAVRLTVVNDGVGAAPRGRGGSGLPGLRERLAPLGGTLETVQVGETFTLTVVVPPGGVPEGQDDDVPRAARGREEP